MNIHYSEDRVTDVFMAIEHGFHWMSTTDYDYWIDVANKLLQIDGGVQNRSWNGKGVPPVGFVDHDLVKKGADAVALAFTWDEAPGGFDFWREVQTRLYDVIAFSPQPSYEDDYDRAMKGI